MILKFLNIPAFIFSLAVGLFFVYIYVPDSRTIFVYPTPNNTDLVEYKDTLGNCFYYNQEKVACPKDQGAVKKIPPQ